jgi:protein-disulfide isomerase
MQPRTPVAAAAAGCAGDQGRFWEMRHLLFEQVETWSKDDVDLDAELTKLAEQLPLDMPKFQACCHGREALERVLCDL